MELKVEAWLTSDDGLCVVINYSASIETVSISAVVVGSVYSTPFWSPYIRDYCTINIDFELQHMYIFHVELVYKAVFIAL